MSVGEGYRQAPPLAWTVFQRWRYASKPASWPKLLCPMLLGHALGLHALARQGEPAVSNPWLVLALLLGFVVSNALYIVWLNDYADRRVDALKRKMFPNAGSQKTIADGILPARQLLGAGALAGVVSLALAVLLATYTGHGSVVVAAALGLLVFWAYSLPPLRLNYRGGGELLEVLGVGLVYPCIGLLAHVGPGFEPEHWLVLGAAPLALASAVASGLSDEQSDRKGGKRTLVVLLGNTLGRRVVEGSLALGVTGLVAASVLSPLPVWLALPGVLVCVACYPAVRSASQAATTGEFSAQGRYKLALHRLIWATQSTLALTVALRLVALSTS